MNRLLKQLLILICVFSPCFLVAQISSSGCEGLTSYTNSDPNDPIFYFPAGVGGDLTATPVGGTPGYNFVWSGFTVGNSSWSGFSAENNVSSSTITNLNPGAYSVVIYDANNTVVGCYRAWILQIMEEPAVDVAPIPAACNGPVNLVGTITGGQITPYSNLPETQMLLDANTEISICFSGSHTWVSDLAFYVVGPASCGSPSLVLSPNPGSIGQGAVCNSGNNITNLCFSTESTNNLNVCSPAPSTLTGTYGTYGATPTAINWSALYGCDASNGGWSVQIYDCIGGDVGSLTDATLVFEGVDGCGDLQSITYSTAPGYSSGIADLSCSAGSASIFTVSPAFAPIPIVCELGYEWSSEPYVYIADSTTSLNITLTEFTDASGNLMPWQDVVFTLSITNECDSVGTSNACFGGNSEDSELFSYLPVGSAIIDPIGPLCETAGTVVLTSAYPGGTWAGTGIVDSANGVFDPALSGPGVFNITYGVSNPCVSPGSFDISVEAEPVIVVNLPTEICVDAPPLDLQDFAQPLNLDFFGPGINASVFDPAAAGVGNHVIEVTEFGLCTVSVFHNITVHGLPIVNAGNDTDVCPQSALNLNASGAQTYSWAPATYLSNTTISNPSASIQADITYTVTGTDVNGCVDTDQIGLTLLPMPEVSVEAVDMICPGQEVTLNGTGSSGDFSWSPGAMLTGSNTASPTATPQTTTTFTLTLTDDCNIQVQASVTVPVESGYSVDAGENTVICQGQTAQLEASVTGNNATMEWSTATGEIVGNATSTQISTSVSGNYGITITSPLNCVYSDAIQVSVTPLPILNLVDSASFCPYGQVNLHAGNNWDQVQWSTGENSNTITVAAEGEYFVTVTENNCSSSGSIIVTRTVLPYLELGPDVVICQGDLAVLDAGYPGSWSTGQNGESINVSSAGTYEVEIEVDNCPETDSIQVTVNPLPLVNLEPSLIGCVDESVMIFADHPNNISYVWNTGETTSSIEVWTPDVYYVTAMNDCGSASDWVDVYFQDCSYSVYIPNSFTPDNDGINDVWKISTFNVFKFELTIFNRWGTLLFQSEDPQAVWTGDVNGGEHYAEDGAYQYLIKFETESGEAIKRTGAIFVTR
jgi:gliding motility-associated-like protein